MVKHAWNVAMHVFHNFMGFVINTTAYRLGLHLLQLMNPMTTYMYQIFTYFHSTWIQPILGDMEDKKQWPTVSTF